MLIHPGVSSLHKSAGWTVSHSLPIHSYISNHRIDIKPIKWNFDRGAEFQALLQEAAWVKGCHIKVSSLSSSTFHTAPPFQQQTGAQSASHNPGQGVQDLGVMCGPRLQARHSQNAKPLPPLCTCSAWVRSCCAWQMRAAKQAGQRCGDSQGYFEGCEML